MMGAPQVSAVDMVPGHLLTKLSVCCLSSCSASLSYSTVEFRGEFLPGLGACHELNCVLPAEIVEALTSNARLIRGGLWEVIKVRRDQEGGARMTGSVPL